MSSRDYGVCSKRWTGWPPLSRDLAGQRVKIGFGLKEDSPGVYTCMTPKKLGTVLVTALLCVGPLGCKRPSMAVRENHPANSSPHDGNEWLTWPGNERDHFVAAYIDGYEEGVHNACAAADHTLDLKTNHSYDHARDEIVLPSGVCGKAQLITQGSNQTPQVIQT